MYDLVNVAKSHPDWEVQIALDPKTTSDLRKKGRITAELATEMSMSSAGGKATEDLGIEFDYEGLESAEVDEEAIAALKLKEVKEDEEVDVDAI